MSKNYIQHRFLPKGSAKKARTCLSFYDLQKHGLVPPLIQSPFALNLLEDISTDNRGSFHNQSDEDSFLLKTRGAYFLCKRESCYVRHPPPLPSLPLVHTFYLQIVILFCKAPPPSPLPLPLLHTFTYFLFANRNLVLHPHPSHCPHCSGPFLLCHLYLRTRPVAPLFPATPHCSYSPSSSVL